MTNLPFGARIEEFEKMRKRRKKQIKGSSSSAMDAFNFFFYNKKEIPLPEAVNQKLKPKAKVKLNKSFEKITR